MIPSFDPVNHPGMTRMRRSAVSSEEEAVDTTDLTRPLSGKTLVQNSPRMPDATLILLPWVV